MFLDRLLTLISNLLPLAGVAWWGWDVFEILILFWMQTVLVVLFALLHLHKLPDDQLGEITVNGVVRPATHRDLLLIVGAVGLVFCAAHLLFLWVMFSGNWSKLVHGPSSFVQHLVVANGVWVALAASCVAGIISYVLTPPRPAFVQWIGLHIGLRADTKNREVLGGVLLALFKRVFLMQAAIIFGGMLANSYGSMAPLVILIALTALSDLGGNKPLTGGTVEIKTG